MSEPVDTTHKEGEEDTGGHYEPVIKLTEQVESKTHEEDEDALFKMRAKLFRFDISNSEWKERGTGEVRLLAHKESKKVRLVMRRDKTLKVCANHFVTSDMRLQPNIGSDRSWVWKVAADVSDGEPVAETLAIRFANAENANQFKVSFEDAQKINASAGPKHEEAEHAEEEKQRAVDAKEAPKEADPQPVSHSQVAEAAATPAEPEAPKEATAEDSSALEAAKKLEALKVEDHVDGNKAAEE